MQSLLLLALVVPCASYAALPGGAAKYQGTVQHQEFGDTPIEFSLEVFKKVSDEEYEGQWSAMGAVENVKITLSPPSHPGGRPGMHASDGTTTFDGAFEPNGTLRGECKQEGIPGGRFELHPVKSAEPSGPTAPLMSPRRRPTPPKMTPQAPAVTSVAVNNDGQLSPPMSSELENSVETLVRSEKLVVDINQAEVLAERTTKQLESLEVTVNQEAEDMVARAMQKAKVLKQNFTDFKQKELIKMRMAKAEVRAGAMLMLKGRLMELRRMQQEQLLRKRPGLPKQFFLPQEGRKAHAEAVKQAYEKAIKMLSTDPKAGKDLLQKLNEGALLIPMKDEVAPLSPQPPIEQTEVPPQGVVRAEKPQPAVENSRQTVRISSDDVKAKVISV